MKSIFVVVTSFMECEITADRDIARGGRWFFQDLHLLWEIIALASAPNNKIVSAAFTICIIKRNSQRAEERKNSAPLKVKPSRAFFNSLHTDARLYVGAIQYYVSLHTPAESMLASLFCCCCSRLVFLSFFCCFIHVYLFSSLLYFYTTYYGNQIGLDHDRMCRKDV